MWGSAENLSVRSTSFREDRDDDEEALRWAALERLPTYTRVRRGIFRNIVGESWEVNVDNLQHDERKVVLDRLFKSVDDNWDNLFNRIRLRFDRVDLEFPKIEVRFQHLAVEAYVQLGSRALPTISNFVFNMTEAFLRYLRIDSGKRTTLTILDDISGIIRPSRLTLLLGPPSSGKTTLLLALAGRLKSDLQMSGDITYNGHGLKEFVPQRTSAYVTQQDWHIAEMTVRETLDFSARCQGVGSKYDMLLELSRREKMAGIKPDEDLDIFIKALALEGNDAGLVVEYILKILGLDNCADTLVGDEMLKGISMSYLGIGVSPGNVPVHHGSNLKVIDKRVRIIEVILRCLILGLAIIGALLIGTDSQVKVIFSIKKEAKFTDMKVLVFLVIANGLAAAYSLIQVLRCIFSMISGSVLFNKPLAWVIFSGDQLMAYLSLAAVAAAAQSGVISKFGQPELQWMKLCNLYGKFCNQIGEGIVSSLIVSLSMIALSGISAFSLFRLYGNNGGKSNAR